MDIDVARLIVQLIGTLGMGAIISGIVTRKITKIEKAKAEKAEEKARKMEEDKEFLCCLGKSIKCLLRSDIFEICDRANRTKKMSLRDRQQLDEAYECYHSLHGNSYCQQVYEKTIDECEVINGIDRIDE